MSSAAVTVNNPVQSSTYQPKQQQRQTAKDVIAENVKALIAQLEAGKSDALTAYLDAMARFHNYSFGNILAIARQKPTATNVAGMFTWNQLGRRVKKGEKGIQILAPMIGTRRKKAGARPSRMEPERAPLFWLDFAPSTSSMFRKLKEPSFPHLPQSPAKRERILTGSLTLYSSRASSLNTTSALRQRKAQATAARSYFCRGSRRRKLSQL